MKKILITGKNSYIGTSVEKWLLENPNEYAIETIDLRDGSWIHHDFSTYDVVYHVAGIAHVSSDPKLKEHYYKVNRDLTIEVATKAKNEDVSQFIFMSSIIVYGNVKGLINHSTLPNPVDFYGDSKLQAEKGLKEIENEKFKVVILRPPMIYGKNSKKLGKLPAVAMVNPKNPYNVGAALRAASCFGIPHAEAQYA